MTYLSRKQIEQIAESIVCQYKRALVPEKRLCYFVDPTELASLLGYTVDYTRKKPSKIPIEWQPEVCGAILTT